jgi:hypothetical protein
VDYINQLDIGGMKLGIARNCSRRVHFVMEYVFLVSKKLADLSRFRAENRFRIHMAVNWLRRLEIILLWAALLLSVTACGELDVTATEQISPPNSTGSESIEVDPVFREFYDRLGGRDVLGLPIAVAFEKDGLWQQYTQSALLQRNALAPTTQRFSLAALGDEITVHDHPMAVGEQQNQEMDSGFVIYSKFVPVYNKLERSRFMGLPITQPLVDRERGRIVQYFKNLGVYSSANDPNDRVHFLEYGAMDCKDCNYHTSSFDIISARPEYSEPFLDAIRRIGLDMVGKPLSSYYRSPDGNYEQVYENVVVYSQPGNPDIVSLRSLPELVGETISPLVARLDDAGMVFKPIRGTLGHNVPKIFEEYIAAHGGAQFSGQPVAELIQVGNLYRQCFKNYCLEYDPAQAEGARIRGVPFGTRYIEMYPPDRPAASTIPLKKDDVVIAGWEDLALIPSDKQQKINLIITQKSDGAPIPQIEASVSIQLPDGSYQTYPMPPTDQAGATSVLLDPIFAPNSTVIRYSICLKVNSPEPICVDGSFVIWGNN